MFLGESSDPQGNTNRFLANCCPNLSTCRAERAFKFAHSTLSALMATLVSSIVVHGHLPQSSIDESVIVPIIKNTNKRVNEKITIGQYVCQTLKCSKIIEVVIFNRISTFLQSSSNQFGFKPKHGTELCVFSFNQLLRFYKKTWVCHACRLLGCLEGF